MFIKAVWYVLDMTLWYINIDPGSHRGWKISFHYKFVIFRVQLLIYQRVTCINPYN